MRRRSSGASARRACAVGLAATFLLATNHATAVTPPAVVRPLPFDNLPRHAETHFNFVVVGVADSERAIAFYTQVLGMRERGRAQPDLQHFEVIVGFDDAALSPGISLKYRNGPPQPRGNGSSALNLVVHDLQARVARVESLGGKVTLPYFRKESGAVVYGYATIEDPDGNAIELVEYFKLPTPPKR